MAFKLFEFLEQFMTGAFLITLTQFEKTGSTGKVLFRWKPKKLNSTFETKNRSRTFAPFARSYLEKAIYFIFSRCNSIELKKYINILRFFPEKNSGRPI